MHAMRKEPVRIIGAGPGGLTAAIALRKRGFPVTVFEKAPDVGHRLNGDFQCFENWTLGEDIKDMLGRMGIEINFLCIPWYGGLLYAPGAGPLEIRSDMPIFYLVKRGDAEGALDRGLKKQALSLGAEILFRQYIDAVEGRAIVATGPKRIDTLGLGIIFETSSKDRAAVVFDDSLAPKGYAYLLVHHGSGTMVTVLYRDHERGEEFASRAERFFRENLDLEIRNVRRFGGFGNFFLRDTQIDEGKYYVGEAGGFQDGLWGFGMRYAMASGFLAAQSVADGTDYDRLWKKEFKQMLETSMINRFLIEGFGHAGYRYLARRLACGDPRDFLRKHYHYSFFKHLLLPLARKRYEGRRRKIMGDSRGIIG